MKKKVPFLFPLSVRFEPGLTSHDFHFFFFFSTRDAQGLQERIYNYLSWPHFLLRSFHFEELASVRRLLTVLFSRFPPSSGLAFESVHRSDCACR